MCRLAVYGQVDFSPLARNLHQLENSCGGDGNGYYHPDRELLMRGAQMTTAEIAHESYGRPGPHMFHTRLATEGDVIDRLNHPFPLGPGAVLMHNGGWWEWLEYAYDGEESDTEAAASLVAAYGPGVLMDREFDYSGVWIVAYGDEIMVITRGLHNFHFQWLKNGGYFHASERVKHTPLKKTLQARDNTCYTINNRGGIKEVHLNPVALPEPMFVPVEEEYGYPAKWTKYVPAKKAAKDYEGTFDDTDMDDEDEQRYYDELEDELYDEYQYAVERDNTTPSWVTWRDQQLAEMHEWEVLAKLENEEMYSRYYDDADEFGKKTPFGAGE